MSEQLQNEISNDKFQIKGQVKYHVHVLTFYLHIEFPELTLFVEGSWIVETGEDCQHCCQSPVTNEHHAST